MHAIVLAASYERKRDANDRIVPLPLLNLMGEPYLTTLAKKLAAIQGVNEIHIVTNELLKPQVLEWAAGLTPSSVKIRVVSDGTHAPEEQLGAMGDLLFVLETDAIQDDILVVGGDNWFAYDLQEFVDRSVQRSPAVVVTALPSGVDHTRFGLVELDGDDRVVQFLEKPRTRLPFKASCVYFFAAASLKYFGQFAKENSTKCTPGTFVSWLVGKTPVYGVKMNATWYDISGTQQSRLQGPDSLEFRDQLRMIVSPISSPWQRVAARQMQWASAPEDLVDLLHDTDPNTRIVAAMLLGRAKHLLNEEGRREVIAQLVRLLDDTACNQYEYGGFQCDEDELTLVCEAAAQALVDLQYANDIDSVRRRASERL